MDNTITYLNTDLDLASADDLTELAAALKAGGLCLLHVDQSENGKWYARFETNADHTEPALDIAAMLSIIESLAEPLQSRWKRCAMREFNIGYDCGAEPWGFNQSLSAELLARIAAVGGSLGISLYPDRAREEVDDESLDEHRL